MSEIRLNIADLDFAHDDETREARHELLASFLGAYVDGELPPETRSQIDAHLMGCARCRRELDVHRALRDRLGNEPVPAASAALRNRISQGIRNAPSPTLTASVDVTDVVEPRRRVASRTWAGIGVLAFATIATLTSITLWRAPHSAAATVVTAQSVPLFTEVLENYRRVTAGNLPGRALDLDAVRAAVPFAFVPLANNSLRLFGAWTTSVATQPAVVLYYRWNDRILLQYFVTDQLLFQSPGVRASLAKQGSASVTERGDGMLVWAEPEYGTLLVGNFTPEQLASLRDASLRDASHSDASHSDASRSDASRSDATAGDATPRAAARNH